MKAKRIAAAALALLALYYVTIPQNHSETEDAFDYAYQVETASYSELIHSHHLIYLPLVKVVYSAGIFGGAFNTMLSIDLLLGAAGVVFVYCVARSRLGLNAPAALFSATFLAFSYGYWRYAVAAEVYIPAMFTHALLCQLVFAPESNARRDFLAAGVAAIAIAIHGPVAAPLAVIAVPVYLAIKRRFRSLVVYGVVATATLLVAYYVAYRLHSHDGGALRDFVAFVRGPVVEEAGTFSAASLPKAVLGFGASFVSSNIVFAFPALAARLQALMPYRNLSEEMFMAQAFSPWFARLSVVSAIALISGAFYVASQLRFGRQQSKRFFTEPIAVALLAWMAAYIVLVTIVSPDSPELWICFLLPLALTIGLLLDRFFKDKTLRVPLVFCGLLFVQNLCGMAMIHSPASDYNAHKARWVVAHAGSGDLIYTRDADVFTRYLRYHLDTGATVINCWDRDAAATEQLFNANREAAGQTFIFTDVFEPPTYLQSRHGEIVEGLRTLKAHLGERLQPTADPNVLRLLP